MCLMCTSGRSMVYRHPIISIFTVSKYPPEISYACITLGANLVGLYLMSLVDCTRRWARFVLVYGRSPLIFYITHWSVEGSVGRLALRCAC